jgi:hypothetical protein
MVVYLNISCMVADLGMSRMVVDLDMSCMVVDLDMSWTFLAWWLTDRLSLISLMTSLHPGMPRGRDCGGAQLRVLDRDAPGASLQQGEAAEQR